MTSPPVRVVTGLLYGRKPNIPILKPLDLGTEQRQAIANNVAATPSAEGLVSRANQFSADQVTRLLSTVIPGFSSMTASASSNIDALLKGDVPTDVSQAVQDSAAASALGGGFAGSGAGRNLVARDLGLTSLALTEKGLSSAESWMKTLGSLYEPSQINLSSMFVTPQQQATFDTQERNLQFERDYLREQISAMPDPRAVGMANFLGSTLHSVIGAVGGMAGGGMGGMMGGMGGGMGGGGGSGGDGGGGLGTPYSGGLFG